MLPHLNKGISRIKTGIVSSNCTVAKPSDEIMPCYLIRGERRNWTPRTRIKIGNECFVSGIVHSDDFHIATDKTLAGSPDISHFIDGKILLPFHDKSRTTI